jgi:hypothetical protein
MSYLITKKAENFSAFFFAYSLLFFAAGGAGGAFARAAYALFAAFFRLVDVKGSKPYYNCDYGDYNNIFKSHSKYLSRVI